MSRSERAAWINKAAERIDETDGASCALIAVALVLNDALDELAAGVDRLAAIARILDEPGSNRP